MGAGEPLGPQGGPAAVFDVYQLIAHCDLQLLRLLIAILDRGKTFTIV